MVNLAQFAVCDQPQILDMTLGKLKTLHQLFAALVGRHTLKRRHHPQIAFRIVAINQAQQQRFNSGFIHSAKSAFTASENSGLPALTLGCYAP